MSRRKKRKGKPYQIGPYQYRLRQINTRTGKCALGTQWHRWGDAERIAHTNNQTPGAVLTTVEYPPLEPG